MSYLHETVAEKVSATMVEPGLCFIPHQDELACHHGLHHDDAPRPSKKSVYAASNSSVQQLYTRLDFRDIVFWLGMIGCSNARCRNIPSVPGLVDADMSPSYGGAAVPEYRD